MLPKQQKRKRRHKRVRAKAFGTNKVPRLCVFRSPKHIYAQLINDEKGKTLVAAGDLEIKNEKRKKSVSTASDAATAGKPASAEALVGKEEKIRTRKVILAYEVGKLLAQKAQEKKIKKVVFDRGGYKYHGRVKAVAEGAREGGLEF